MSAISCTSSVIMSPGLPLLFVNITDPSADKNAQRRNVRSHASAYSHRSGLRQESKNPRRPRTVRAGNQRQLSSKSHSGEGQDDRRGSEASPVMLSGETSYDPEQERRLSQYTGVSSHWHSDNNASGPLVSQQQLQDLVTASSAKSNPTQLLGAGRIDPFETYPVASQSWFPRILDHWRTVTLPRGFEIMGNSKHECDEYLVWDCRAAQAEPAYFYMLLWSSCAELIATVCA